MKLKSLEINGFKSFADKTVIEFMPGMTGIVGPNGSGKSNIIEAIRWVMGEQSPRGLRGDKMTDVIFGGSTKRARLNRAEVTIIFDNSDHYLKSEYNEIQITRRLYRDGNSSYLINGTEVRLKDITDLFTDSGLGRESFSIISQGRVESIFNAKPEDRRNIIEEVAGVLKYKKSKEKAQSELSVTDENLARVEDIITEIEGRVEPLAEQAQKAEAYLTQKAQFDLLDRSRLVLDLDKFQNDKQTTDRELAVLTQQLTEFSEQVKVVNSELENKRQERTSAQLARDEIQTKLLALTEQRERLSGQRNVDSEREAAKQQEIAELTTRSETLAQTIAEQTTHVDALQSELDTATHELAQQENVLSDALGNTTPERLQAIRQELAQQRETYIQQLQQVATLQNEAKNIERENSRSADERVTLENRFESAQSQLNEHKQQIASLEQQKASLAEAAEAAQQQVADTLQQYNEQQQALEQRRTRWFGSLSELNKLKARLESIQSMDDYAAFYQGVRNIMQQRSQFPGLVGVVAEQLSVPEQYALAVETALGSALQQVIVDTEQTAKSAIKYLTQNRLGRVTFLPVETIKARQLNAQQVSAARQVTGYLGVASELVSMNAETGSVLENLLGTTIVAQDIEAATQIARATQYRFRIVTLDGQLVNAGGSITGGAHKNTGKGLLQQRGEVDTLQKEVDELETASAADEKTIQSLTDELEALSQTGETQRQAMNEANEALQLQSGKIDLAQAALQQLTEQFEATQSAFDANQVVINNHDTAVSQNAQTSKQAEAKAEATKQRIGELEERLNHLDDEQKNNSEQLMQKRETIARLKTEVDSLQQRLVDAKARLSTDQQQHDSLVQRLADLQTVSVDQSGQNVEEQLAQMNADYQSATDQVTELNERLEHVAAAMTQLEEQQQTLQSTQNKSLSQQSTLAAAQAKFATRIENANSQLMERYELTLEQARQDVSDLPEDELRNELKVVKTQIDEIGSVNVGAIEEYAEVSERYEFLTGQRDDLVAARENLLTTMSEMDEEVQTRFKQTFDEIAEQFSVIFKRMFGGGQAKLTLTDPEHLLTSGIDIMAQPPGKKFQQLSLLSGGEKALTAITLLFSILAVRPVPFAVLDETEAALDEANVDRFASYLHHFGGETQFIVITHRKGTMVNANVLYGVTMQESGISQMVSVTLDDLDDEA